MWELLDEGAGSYDSAAYHRRLDELAGELQFSAGQDELTGSLRMLKRNLAETADLLRVALGEPRFADDAVERIRAETTAMLARQARNPRSLAGRLWMRDAFEDHPYGKDSAGTAASVAAIAQADLADFVARHVHRKGLVVGAVGDITAAELSGLLDRVFGGFHADGHRGQEFLHDHLPVHADDSIVRAGHSHVGLNGSAPGQYLLVGGGKDERRVALQACEALSCAHP